MGQAAASRPRRAAGGCPRLPSARTVCSSSTVSSRSTGMKPPARSFSRSRALNQRSPLRQSASARASGRTTSASIARSSAGRTSSAFERVGTKILMVEPNYDYRAISHEPAERQRGRGRVREVGVVGLHRHRRDQRPRARRSHRLPDARHARRRRPAAPGASTGSTARGARCFMPNTKAFPKNTEIDVTTTFVSDGAADRRRGGGGARRPDWRPHRRRGAVAGRRHVRQHHSFIELPDANYKPRAFDARVRLRRHDLHGLRRALRRHRAQAVHPPSSARRRDPVAAMSEPVEPIVYYVDRGTPEPIRTALVEGARWWNQAFEAAGFRNGFQVELMPEGADPMDVRYNTITWVHRSTRGWSYGSSITDPRTGEIIKGHVSLGSLRDAAGLPDRRRPALAVHRTAPRSRPRFAETGARAAAPALGARSRPHDRARSQLLQQHEGPHLGARLSAPARDAASRRHDGLLEGLRRRASASGTRSRSGTATPYFARARRSRRRCRRFSTRRGRKDMRYMTNQDIDAAPATSISGTTARTWRRGTAPHDDDPPRRPRAIRRDRHPERISRWR